MALLFITNLENTDNMTSVSLYGRAFSAVHDVLKSVSTDIEDLEEWEISFTCFESLSLADLTKNQFHKVYDLIKEHKDIAPFSDNILKVMQADPRAVCQNKEILTHDDPWADVRDKNDFGQETSC